MNLRNDPIERVRGTCTKRLRKQPITRRGFKLCNEIRYIADHVLVSVISCFRRRAYLLATVARHESQLLARNNDQAALTSV